MLANEIVEKQRKYNLKKRSEIVEKQKKYNKKNQKLTLRAYYMYKLAIRHPNLRNFDRRTT